MNPSSAQPNTIVIHQSLDAAGNPAPARFEQVIRHVTINTLGSDAMDFLRPLNPRQTDRPGVFTYSDPLRGSGELHLSGFSASDAQRIQEFVRMGEITAAVGPEPMRPADIAIGTALVPRTNNPWVLIGMGIVFVTFSVVLLVASVGAGGNAPVYVTLGVLMGLVGIAGVIVGAIRAPWWHRARAQARRDGGQVPPDIRGL